MRLRSTDLRSPGSLPARREDGYVLLLTLFLLVLGVATVAELARTSVRSATVAARETTELQLRWAQMSSE